MELIAFFILFLPIWIYVGYLRKKIFIKSGNLEQKRRLLVPFNAGSSALFLLFSYIVGFRGMVFLAIFGIQTLLLILGVVTTKFCIKCTSTIRVNILSRQSTKCNYCGFENGPL